MFLDTILIKLFFTSNKCIIKWSNISEHKKKTERGVVSGHYQNHAECLSQYSSSLLSYEDISFNLGFHSKEIRKHV